MIDAIGKGTAVEVSIPGEQFPVREDGTGEHLYHPEKAGYGDKK